MEPKGLALHWKVLIALVLGVAIGAAVNSLWTAQVWASMGVGDSKMFLEARLPAPGVADPNANASTAASAVRFIAKANKFVGDLFLQSLKFIAVPVVVFSLIIAVAGVGDIRKIGRIGIKTLLCFLLTLIIAVAIAVVLGKVVQPGSFVTPETRESILAAFAGEAAGRVQTAHQLKDSGVWAYLVGIIPTNPFNALANAQMMQVVATAFLLGVGLTMIPRERAEPVVKFAEGISEAVMALVRIIMIAAPFAVFCLITQFVSVVGVDALRSVIVYCACVIGGLAIVLVIEYPLLMLLMTPRDNRVGYKRFFRGLAPAQALAFSSSSSSATLPVTIQCARDRLGVPEDIANFVCPMGTTLNMDGTALYQVISVLFLAQLYGIELTLAQHLTVGIMSAVVAVGTPGLPGASVVMMAIVLESVNVPPQGIAIILAVDRILDMARTIVNVSGDAVACVVVAGSEGRLLKASEVLDGGESR